MSSTMPLLSEEEIADYHLRDLPGFFRAGRNSEGHIFAEMRLNSRGLLRLTFDEFLLATKTNDIITMVKEKMNTPGAYDWIPDEGA